MDSTGLESALPMMPLGVNDTGETNMQFPHTGYSDCVCIDCYEAHCAAMYEGAGSPTPMPYSEFIPITKAIYGFKAKLERDNDKATHAAEIAAEKRCGII